MVSVEHSYHCYGNTFAIWCTEMRNFTKQQHSNGVRRFFKRNYYTTSCYRTSLLPWHTPKCRRAKQWISNEQTPLRRNQHFGKQTDRIIIPTRIRRYGQDFLQRMVTSEATGFPEGLEWKIQNFDTTETRLLSLISYIITDCLIIR